MSLLHELQTIITAPLGWLLLAAFALLVGAVLYAFFERYPAPVIRMLSDEEREAQILARPVVSDETSAVLHGYYPKHFGPKGLSEESRRAASLRLASGARQGKAS